MDPEANGGRAVATEEFPRDLAALCEALRVLCARAHHADLTPADLEPVAAVAAFLAAEVARSADAVRPCHA